MSRRDARNTSTKIRCAIYTRKSTEEGLDLEFNTLDAQRESAEARRGRFIFSSHTQLQIQR